MKYAVLAFVLAVAPMAHATIDARESDYLAKCVSIEAPKALKAGWQSRAMLRAQVLTQCVDQGDGARSQADEAAAVTALVDRFASGKRDIRLSAR
jgi:hypothetical protein